MAPLISSQRYLNPQIVERKARNFKVFIARTIEIELRGKCYRILLDGHHNLAAARMVGAKTTWKGPARKLGRIMQSMSPAAFAAMLINNLTDSDWYYVDSGEVVSELLAVERVAA